ncbi:hypothetical protein [Avibacterium paragallinarum]|uniref:Outer membrane antigenic lipoprotein B n=1 Tax=Avibacterium paragallinarum TaxID=728 RepID=A0A0F5EP63_AVIPA|nr:hypothetical protein [Avibacterium paragallinarum]AZI14763.1 hypothetical protein EIA51_09190 [Avibacterium paragallinarum]MEE3607527.1 hypothetical protein [Avibacterium paragallinarum]MEE3620097.1 hypothetical protein [Avibacterium paragallinarum]MEE3667781.1 hypothetical protein [Avibacterium paragallinarum]MEE3680009.1 hypothetical protein [Avibacterium paragallinarum]
MNKWLSLLSIILLLPACATTPSPNDENALSPGVMQPVANSGAADGAEWQPKIKSIPMPESMN